jgi:hypothetical protein
MDLVRIHKHILQQKLFSKQVIYNSSGGGGRRETISFRQKGKEILKSNISFMDP